MSEKRLPNDSTFFVLRDLPRETTEEGIARMLLAAEIPLTENRVSIKRHSDGTASALIGLGKQVLTDVVNAHIKAHGKDFRLITFQPHPKRGRERHHNKLQNLPPLTPEAA